MELHSSLMIMTICSDMSAGIENIITYGTANAVVTGKASAHLKPSWRFS